MASENKRGNREVKKPKKVAPKVVAAAPSSKGLPAGTSASPKKK